MAKRPTVLRFFEGGVNKSIKISQPMESVDEISSTSHDVNSDKNITSNDGKQTKTSQDIEEKIKKLIEEIGDSFVTGQESLMPVTEVKRFLYGSAGLQLFLHKLLTKNAITKREDIQLVATYLGLPHKGVSEYLDEMYPKRGMLCTARFC